MDPPSAPAATVVVAPVEDKPRPRLDTSLAASHLIQDPRLPILFRGSKEKRGWSDFPSNLTKAFQLWIDLQARNRKSLEEITYQFKDCEERRVGGGGWMV